MDYVIDRLGCSFRTTCPFPFKFCKFVPEGLLCDLRLWFKSFMLVLWIFDSFQFRFLGKFWYDFLKYISCLIFISKMKNVRSLIRVRLNFRQFSSQSDHRFISYQPTGNVGKTVYNWHCETARVFLFIWTILHQKIQRKVSFLKKVLVHSKSPLSAHLFIHLFGIQKWSPRWSAKNQ